MMTAHCDKCGANITFLDMPSGAKMPVNYGARVMIVGEGEEQGVERRSLATIRGRLIVRGREQGEIELYRNAGRGELIKFVWINHFTACPARESKPAKAEAQITHQESVSLPTTSNLF